MNENCEEMCMAQCLDLSFSNKTLESLWTCLTFLCNVTVEDHQRTSFLRYLATNVSVDMNASRYSNCTTNEAFLLETIWGYAIPINGYIAPPIILLTIINNILVCIVLLKPNMRSSTNVIFIAMAMSDMFTGLSPFSVFIYFYATERVNEWIPYNWCYSTFVLFDYIPVIFHTTSIWLTMALAIQRYICVCHPFKARSWCTMRNVIYAICAIYIFAMVVETPSFFRLYFTETWRRSRLNPTVIVSACVRKWRPWLAANFEIYFYIYYWIRIIFINLIPCLTLVVLNTLLIFTMRKAMKKRIELLRQNMKSESQKLKETNSTTMMLITVLVFFLLVEFPVAITMTLWVVRETFNINLFSVKSLKAFILFSNLFILLSSPINFYIYCGMSSQFRETFKRLFTGDARPKERE